MPFIRSLLLAAVVALFSAGAVSAAPPSLSLQESLKNGVGLVLKVQSRCETLRRACAGKRELGETGEGNCRRYREECSGRSASYCAHLRQACLYKGERGELGKATVAAIAKSAEGKTEKAASSVLSPICRPTCSAL